MKTGLICLSILFFTALSSQNIKSGSNDWKFETITRSQKVHIGNDVAKTGMSIDVSLTYPVSVPSNIDLKDMQSSFVGLFFFDDFDGSIHNSSPKEAVDAMMEDYIHMAKQYASRFENGRNDDGDGRFEDYEENLKSAILFRNEYVVSVNTTHHYYTGKNTAVQLDSMFYYTDSAGRKIHPYEGATIKSMYYYIDKQDGTVITLDSLVKPAYMPILGAVVQNRIAQRGMTRVPSESIVLMPDLRLEYNTPSRSFYFCNKGMVFVYGTSEIAVNSQGVVEIIIPYEQVLPMINEKYLPHIESLQKYKQEDYETK